MRHGEVGIDLDDPRDVPQGLIVPAGPEERGRDILAVGQWVQLVGTLLHLDGLVVALERGQHQPVAVVRVAAVRVQLDAPA